MLRKHLMACLRIVVSNEMQQLNQGDYHVD